MEAKTKLDYFNHWSHFMMLSTFIFVIALVPSVSYFEINAALILVPIGLVAAYTIYMTETYKKEIMKEQNISGFKKLLNYVETRNNKEMPKAKLKQYKQQYTILASIMIIYVVMLISNMS